MKAVFALPVIGLLVAASNLSAAINFVSPASTNPTPPYATWATAATNIQQAVDAAAAGDVILVSNGVFAGSLAVTKPLWVLSFAGSQYTAIDGHGTNRCVWMTNGARFDGFTLTNGFAQDGGGVWCSSSNVYVTNCVIAGNSASAQGGGAWGGTLSRCILDGNSAASGGGAASATLNECILTNNSGLTNGGGVFQCVLNNSVLSRNGATSGGGAFGGTLNNCTLSGNQANSGGGAESAELNNSIIYFNSAQSGSNADNCTLNYCCTTPLPGSGTGNIDMNPQFVTAGSNFRLQLASPCINAGNNALVVNTTDLDLDRNQRIIGGRVDMGAYEFPSGTSPVITMQPTNQTVYSGTDVIISAAADGSQPLLWQWRFNDVAITNAIASSFTLLKVTTNRAGSYSAVVTNSYASVTSQVAVLTVLDAAPSITTQPLSQAVAPGNYITLTADAKGSLPMFWQWLFNGNAIQDATNSSLNVGPVSNAQVGDYSAIASNAFGRATSAVASVSLASGSVSYVWQNSPNPTAPYSNWVTAAHAIQDAVNAAGPGYQVVVSNGVYAGPVNITKPLLLVSLNGPQVTVIDAGYQLVSCVSLTNGASLAGFTVTHGYAYPNGGGVFCGGQGWWATPATNVFITNCVITANRAPSYGGGAYGGTLYNCTLTGNIATNYTGGAYGSALVNCTISTNLAGGANSCLLFNCTVTGNTQYGGGVANSTLYNSLLLGNGGSSYYDAGAVNSTLYNCTLSGNNFGASASTLYNSILYYNGASSGSNYNQSCTLNYCCTTPMPTNGVGSITNAPLFVSQPGSDFHLQANSPCINSGNNAYVTTTTDLDGNPRIVSGTVDIGAYEYQGSGSLISYALLQQCGLPTDGSADFLDSDGDGMNNWQEWIAGTDPTNALSVLRIVSATNNHAAPAITWQSVNTRSYFLQRAGALGGPPGFVTMATNITGQTATTTYIDTNATGRGPFFYRVGVQWP